MNITTTTTLIKTPQKSRFSFKDEKNGSEIIFDSDFDSGNCSEVCKISSNEFDIHTANDCAGKESEGYAKSWFYFSVQGLINNEIYSFNIWRINMLYSLRKYIDVYKPVYKINNGEWNRTENAAKLLIIDEKLVVKFSYNVKGLKSKDKIYFAFSYPFSYSDNQDFIQMMQDKYLNDKEIYFHKEIIVKSCEKRNIDLITISSHEGKLTQRELVFKDSLFPNKTNNSRAFKFRVNKPVILLTARVHPGETPSSHAMNGIINFLLDKEDSRAILLRKYFVFMLVPMINPDGVYNGYYRMDVHNQNLNRYYKTPKITKQPSIYAIKCLAEYLRTEKRLIFYCDLHAHSARKGCFLFGNALDDLSKQVESQLYAKLVSLNCVNFQYSNCIFSKKHMTARDKFEKLTKEGCGRVVLYKLSGLIHSYTLECGFHLSSVKNQLYKPSYEKIDNEKLIPTYHDDSLDDINSSFYNSEYCYFTSRVYNNVGKALLISILDMFSKNPYSRIPNSPYKNISNIRKEISKETFRIDRFRKDQKNIQKMKNLEQLAYINFYKEFDKKKVFEISSTSTNNIIRKNNNALDYKEIIAKTPKNEYKSEEKAKSSNFFSSETKKNKKQRKILDKELERELEEELEEGTESDYFSEEMNDGNEKEEEENKKEIRSETKLIQSFENILKSKQSSIFENKGKRDKNDKNIQSLELENKDKRSIFLQGKEEWKLPKISVKSLDKLKIKRNTVKTPTIAEKSLKRSSFSTVPLHS